MIPSERLQEILDRFEFVEAKRGEASDPGEIASLGREYAGLRDVVATIRDWQGAQADLDAAREMVSDPEMAELAEAEIAEIGVGCEACHGPGSDYFTWRIMKDPERATANGLWRPTREVCMRCHR